LRIIGVSAAVCIAASLVLVLIPRHATRTATRLLAGTSNRPDTITLARHADDARSAVMSAESTLVRARSRAPARPPRTSHPDSTVAAALDTSGPGRAHRDSVAAEIEELDQLLTRVERSPLPSSYRALGGAAALTGQARVQVLLDSLSDVARARDAFDAAGGVDPIFVALTGRVNALGHAIQSVAEARRAALRAALAPYGPVAPVIAVRPTAADTLRLLASVDSARDALSALAVALDRDRALDADLDARAALARTITDASASPIALAGAALVLGMALGFAMTFGVELRRPRVADAAEAARVAGVPTLATIMPRPIDPFRARRAADRGLSPLIDPSSETYRAVYLDVSDPRGTNPLAFPFVAVTGDEAAIVATVATNVAIAAINDSQTALLIDADPDAGLVAAIVGVAREPGVADVLAGRIDWASATQSAPAGRARTLDVIPAGRPAGARPSSPDPADVPDYAPESANPLDEWGHARVDATTMPRADALDDIGRGELRAELLRLGRRYELIVVAAPAGAPRVGSGSILPVSDAIVCARVAFTTLTRLASSVAVLQDSGLRVHGIVLWDADRPPIANR
jgi:Mrp family chromosome partitioning ATPase